jgi:hypothetical protein
MSGKLLGAEGILEPPHAILMFSVVSLPVLPQRDFRVGCSLRILARALACWMPISFVRRFTDDIAPLSRMASARAATPADIKSTASY